MPCKSSLQKNKDKKVGGGGGKSGAAREMDFWHMKAGVEKDLTPLQRKQGISNYKRHWNHPEDLKKKRGNAFNGVFDWIQRQRGGGQHVSNIKSGGKQMRLRNREITVMDGKEAEALPRITNQGTNSERCGQKKIGNFQVERGVPDWEGGKKI